MGSRFQAQHRFLEMEEFRHQWQIPINLSLLARTKQLSSMVTLMGLLMRLKSTTVHSLHQKYKPSLLLEAQASANLSSSAASSSQLTIPQRLMLLMPGVLYP